MDFPQSISLTITNICNLRCQMCGQWSEEGYIHNNKDVLKREMTLADWKRVVDELADHHIASVLLRGGEVFLYPGIIELMEYIHGKGMFISVDTNGTMLKDYAADIVRIGNIHLTISVDGPEAVHDSVRGIPGCFQRIKAGLDVLNQLDPPSSAKISRAICFTISQYSVSGLGVMPDVARSLSIGAIVIVPTTTFLKKWGKLIKKSSVSWAARPSPGRASTMRSPGWTSASSRRSIGRTWRNSKTSTTIPTCRSLRTSTKPGLAMHSHLLANPLHQRRKANRYPAERRGQFLRRLPGLLVWQRERSNHPGAVERRKGRSLPRL